MRKKAEKKGIFKFLLALNIISIIFVLINGLIYLKLGLSYNGNLSDYYEETMELQKLSIDMGIIAGITFAAILPILLIGLHSSKYELIKRVPDSYLLFGSILILAGIIYAGFSYRLMMFSVNDYGSRLTLQFFTTTIGNLISRGGFLIIIMSILKNWPSKPNSQFTKHNSQITTEAPVSPQTNNEPLIDNQNQ